MARSRAIRIGDQIPEKPVNGIATQAERLAQAIRETYCFFYRMYTKNKSYGMEAIPKWDGGFDPSTGNTYKQAIWPKLVGFFLHTNINPNAYIRLQFAEASPSRLPYPNMLQGDACMQRWTVYKTDGQINLRYKVASEFNSLAHIYFPLRSGLKWSNSDAVEYAIRDRSSGASPLIRYILADEHGLNFLKQSLEIPAVNQYAFESTLYSEVLGDRVPASIRTQAESLKQIFS